MRSFYKLVFIYVFFNFSLISFSQTISILKTAVFDNDIIILYNVKGLKFNQSLTVSLYMSRDGGNTFEGPMQEVKGDGENIMNGQSSMVWEATKEMKMENVYAVFDIRGIVVNEKIKKKYFIAYTGNFLTPMGLRSGVLGGIGWYIGAQSNTTPDLKGSYTYTNGTITDYSRFAWYEFTSKHEVSAFMICGGLTYQIARKIYLYGGAGYGKEDYLYEIKEFSYENDAPLGADYARDSKTSATGLAVQAGLYYKSHRFIFSGGASTIRFNTPNWEVGLGLSF